MEPSDWSELVRAIRKERLRLATEVEQANHDMKNDPDGNVDAWLEAMGLAFQTMSVLQSLENIGETMAGGEVS